MLTCMTFIASKVMLEPKPEKENYIFHLICNISKIHYNRSFSNVHQHSYFSTPKLCQLYVSQLSKTTLKPLQIKSKFSSHSGVLQEKFYCAKPLLKQLHYQLVQERCICELLIIVWKTLNCERAQHLHDKYKI